MATLYISGVWKSADKITHVMLHSVGVNNILSRGTKTSEQSVIDRINKPGSVDIVYTIMWNYTDCKWVTGSQVLVVREGYGEILRTHRDKTVKNNLDNLLRMENFV